MSKPNSYFLTDKDLDEIAKKVVSELYSNQEILDYKNNGRTLNGNIAVILDRDISSIYSNIKGHKSLETVLKNSAKFAILSEKITPIEIEFKKIREVCERRKNILNVLNRKYELEKTDLIKNEMDKTKEEISLLENQLNEIANKNTDKPEIKKNILELSKKTYSVLLRADTTSAKLYINICKYLNITINSKEHFGYDVFQNREEFKPFFMKNVDPKEDIYVPPALKNNYGQRRYNNYNNYKN